LTWASCADSAVEVVARGEYMSRCCPDCGRLLRPEIVQSDRDERLVYIVFPEHTCNPAMLRFFDPDSMHEPPFER
jgi:hypothetical protein